MERTGEAVSEMARGTLNERRHHIMEEAHHQQEYQYIYINIIFQVYVKDTV